MFDLHHESQRPSKRHEQLLSEKERDSTASIISIFVIGMIFMLVLMVVGLWK